MATRRHSARGTAMLESVICLPFVMLIFGVVVVMGYGLNERLKADASAHLAGQRFARTHSLTGSEPSSINDATRDVQSGFFGTARSVSVTASVGPRSSSSGDGALAETLTTVFDAMDKAIELVNTICRAVNSIAGGGDKDFLPLKNAQETVTVSVRVSPPLYRSLFPEQNARATIVQSANPYTFDEVKLLGRLLPNVPLLSSPLRVGPVSFPSLVYMLGMCGEHDGCY